MTTRAAALVAHSGGPTAVINASLMGLLEEAEGQSAIARLYGARFGIEGIVENDFIDLSQVEPGILTAIGQAPSSVLGTSRRPVSPADLDRVLEVCRTRDERF